MKTAHSWFWAIYLAVVAPAFVGFETYQMCHRNDGASWQSSDIHIIDRTGVFPRCYKGVWANNREGWNGAAQDQRMRLSQCWEES